MGRSLWQESFVPVMLIVLLASVGLMFVEYRVSQEADIAVVIDIPLQEDNEDNDGVEEDAGIDVEDVASLGSEKDALIINLMDAKKWGEAEEILKVRIATEGTSSDYMLQGIIRMKQGQYEQALKSLTKAVSVKPLESSAYFYRGVVYAKLNQNREAVSDYQHLIALMPYHFEAHYNLGLTQKKLGENLEALETFQKALKLASGKRKARTYYNIGLLYSDKGEAFTKDAASAFESAIRLHPSYIYPRFGLADLEPHNEEGQKRALELYDTVLRLKPDMATAHLRKALAYSRIGKTKSSIASYKKAIRNKPEYFKAHYNLGIQYIRAKKLDEAAEQFMWVLEREPKHARSYFNLGRIEAKRGNFKQAQTHYSNAIKLRQGNYPEAHVNVGILYMEQGELKQARAAFEQALKYRKEYAQAWYHIAELYLLQKDMEQAEDSLKKALALKESFADAWVALAGIYVQGGKVEQAVSAYEQALQAEKPSKSLQLKVAMFYESQDLLTQSVKVYEKVFADYPTYVPALRGLGRLYHRMEQHEKAKTFLLSAMEQAPESLDTGRELASFYVDSGELDEALVLYESLLEQAPTDMDIRYGYINALIKKGFMQKAKEEIQKGLRLKPDDAVLMQYLESLG